MQFRHDLRIVLMSATMNAEMFASYFEERMPAGSKVPILHIPGYTFPVTVHFLEDALQLTGCTASDLQRGPGGQGGGKGTTVPPWHNPFAVVC